MGRIRDVSIVMAGILLFALFIHDPLPLRAIAFAGLTGAALMIGYSMRGISILHAFAVYALNRKVFIYLIPAIVLGIGLGLLTRNVFDLSLLPGAVTGIAFITPVIGATEELIFRGYIQGHVRPIGRIFSIVYASTVHTCYKLLVILSLSVPLHFDFFFLIFWTFVGGLAFGALRELSRSTIPPIIAHAAFDIMLYGGMSVAPVWVWS
jgi:membrane protease YdiL (CAAX protease family)